MRRRLVLFDIDGTLISDDGAAREAYSEAIETVYGYKGNLARWDFSGLTDPQITWMILREESLTDSEIESGLPELWRLYLEGLARNATPQRVRVLAGIRPLVEHLHEHSEVLLGLLTGNVEPGARIKLAAPRLNEYFPIGAFGSDNPAREMLPPVAIERAAALDGHRFAGRDVVIIGDSIFDVRCGVPHNATTIAVASGKTSAEKLRAENPHHFFDDASDTEAMLNAILG